MLKIKHVSLNKCIFDILIGPRYEELVVMIGLVYTAGQRKTVTMDTTVGVAQTFSVRPAEK